MGRVRRVAAIATGLLATLLAAGTASAHVSVLPETLTQDVSGQLIIRVPNERTDANTVRVRVGIPEQVTVYSVGPTPPGFSGGPVHGLSVPSENACTTGHTAWPVANGVPSTVKST